MDELENVALVGPESVLWLILVVEGALLGDMARGGGEEGRETILGRSSPAAPAPVAAPAAAV